MNIPNPNFLNYDSWVSELSVQNPGRAYPSLIREENWQDYAAEVTRIENLSVDFFIYKDWKSWARALTETV